MKTILVIFVSNIAQIVAVFSEPHCPSYDFQERILEKTVRMELQIELLQKENKELKLEQNNYNNGLAALGTRLDEIEARDRLNPEQQIAEVADTNGFCTTNQIIFRATLSKQSVPLTSGQTVVFDTVHENFGNAYNAASGKFTSPRNGTYVFQFAIGNPTNKPGALFMMKNKEIIDYVIAGHTRGWNVAAKTVFLYLKVGDVAFVVGESHIAGTYGTGRHHSSFSGTLMHVC